MVSTKHILSLSHVYTFILYGCPEHHSSGTMLFCFTGKHFFVLYKIHLLLVIPIKNINSKTICLFWFSNVAINVLFLRFCDQFFLASDSLRYSHTGHRSLRCVICSECIFDSCSYLFYNKTY